jgi:hypothetical protein
MSARLAEIAARRVKLCDESGLMRDALVDDVDGLKRRFRTADRLVAAARSGTTRALLVGAAALVVVGRPRQILKLALRTLALWPLVSPLLPRLKALFQGPEASA